MADGHVVGALRSLKNVAVDQRLLLLRSTLYTEPSGNYRIVGTVTESGIPGAYPVRLYDRQTGRLLAETQSAANGDYAFSSLVNRLNGYFTVAHDYGNNPLNAAIADLVTPEPMP